MNIIYSSKGEQKKLIQPFSEEPRGQREFIFTEKPFSTVHIAFKHFFSVIIMMKANLVVNMTASNQKIRSMNRNKRCIQTEFVYKSFVDAMKIQK